MTDSTTAKKTLQSVRILDIRIDAKIAEIAQLKDMVTKVTPTLTGVTIPSGNSDKIGDAVSRIVDLQNEINADIDAYVDAKRSVSGILDRITDADQLQVLNKRYIQYKQWETIATDMNMTLRNVHYIHGSALKTVSEIMNDMKGNNND